MLSAKRSANTCSQPKPESWNAGGSAQTILKTGGVQLGSEAESEEMVATLHKVPEKYTMLNLPVSSLTTRQKLQEAVDDSRVR